MKTSKWIQSTNIALCLCIPIVLGSCALEPSYTFMATGNGSAISVECGWWLWSTGPGTSLTPPGAGVAYHEVLFSDTYQGADWWKYKISAADALAGEGQAIYVRVTSSQTGGYETRIVDEKGKRVDTIHYFSSGPESQVTIRKVSGPGSASGGDSPYATVICTELHRQGLMDEATFKADQAFGKLLRERNRDVLAGYHFWAMPVVGLMQKSRVFTQIVNVLAKPWSIEMAYRIGARDEGSFAGKILMFIGVPVCRTIGRAIFWAGNVSLHEEAGRPPGD